MRQRFWNATIVAGFLTVATLALAGVGEIAETPTPITVGRLYHYSADVSEGASEFYWHWKCPDDAAWLPDWYPPYDSGEPAIDWFEPRFGEQDIRLRVWFSCSGEPPLEYWGQTIRRIDVIPPDNDTIEAGLGEDSEGFPNMAVPVVFQIRSGPTECGGVIEGAAYERIERFWPWSRPYAIFDSGWVGESDFFSLDSGGEIHDTKSYEILTYEGYLEWEALPVGAVIDEFYQTNLIEVKNCEGDEQNFIFARRKFQRQKAVTGHSKLC